MVLFLVKVGEVQEAHSEALAEAKSYALGKIKEGKDATIECYAVSPGQPTPVITLRHDPELGDWVESQ